MSKEIKIKNKSSLVGLTPCPVHHLRLIGPLYRIFISFPHPDAASGVLFNEHQRIHCRFTGEYVIIRHKIDVPVSAIAV